MLWLILHPSYQELFELNMKKKLATCSVEWCWSNSILAKNFKELNCLTYNVVWSVGDGKQIRMGIYLWVLDVLNLHQYWTLCMLTYVIAMFHLYVSKENGIQPKLWKSFTRTMQIWTLPYLVLCLKLVKVRRNNKSSNRSQKSSNNQKHYGKK